MECMKCGTCCTAPDITALGKPLGQQCPHLRESMHCAIYDVRPEVCRQYRPDDLCTSVAAETLAERVSRYLKVFGLDGGEP